MIGYWSRLCQGKESKLSTIIYKLLKNQHDNNKHKSPWLTRIKSMLDECGMSNLWDCQCNVNKEWVKKSVSLRLDDIAKQEWSNEVDTNKLCLNYRLFKSDCSFEKYLLNLDARDRISLCRVRCGNHRLPVSESRYRTSGSLNTCTLCNSGEVGDEYHYVLTCTALADQRKKYIKNYYYTRPNTVKFSELFNSKGKQMSRLATFVKLIMSLFK